MNLAKALSRRWLLLAIILLLIIVIVLLAGTRDRQRAAALLVRLEYPHPPAIAHWDTCTVDEQAISLPGGIPAHIYRPRERRHAPGIILLHGVHHLGIEEPRLRNFAKVFAESCVLILTPLVRSLADYRIEPAAIDDIGRAAIWLSGELHKPVGIVGLSFAGGLSLVAATDARYSQNIAFVLAVGAHSDLGRVARFLATGQSELPDGSKRALQPEQYGALVLAFIHPEEFFPKKESSRAQSCMRLWLSEEYERARSCENDLSSSSKVIMESLFQYRIEHLQGRLLAEVDRQKETMAKVSPSGRLSGIKIPVFLLHGDRDGVIPPSETEWLAREIPPPYLRAVLISPAVAHVDPAQTSLRDKWRLVSFLAAVLGESEHNLSSFQMEVQGSLH